MTDETLDIHGTFKEMLARLNSSTNRFGNFFLRRIEVIVIEMEDVLFHLDSAVMMPERPAGKSSSDNADDPDSAEARDKQNKVSGLKAIAIAIKQFEFDPRKRLLVAGHTDTSGAVKMNFDLSDLRAQNVLFLIEGNRDEWAKISESRHKIEDYQQIMKFVAGNTRFGFPCDPGDLNNQFNENTSNATKNFIDSYNLFVLSGQAPSGSEQIPEGMHKRVKNDGAHKWPVEMWKAVFDIYNDEIAFALGATRDQLNGTFRSRIGFADPEKKFVGCGESFPIDHPERSDFRSQANRRVELLLFDQDEIPVLDCPAIKTRVHTEEECPIWHKLHFKPVYVDPTDLTAVAYHLKFAYFDRIHQKLKDVPDGLPIKVFENGSTEIPGKITFSGGVYQIKVQDKPRTDLHFTFATTDKFLFSADSSTEPVIVTKTPAEIAALPFTERIKFYDLPAEWSSQNYFTRHDGNFATGGRFRTVMQTTKQFKPFGGNTTVPDQPLTFSLDDIVLATANRSQVVRDQNSTGTGINLDNNSRFALLHIDHVTTENVGGTTKNMQRIKIHNPEPTQAFYTNVQFNANLITDVPGNTRVVYFCNVFHDVFDKRSKRGDPGFSLAANHVVGARLALANDADIHASKSVIATNSVDRAMGYAISDGNPAIGNYELHYLHNCDELDGKPLMYLFVFWCCRFVRQSTSLEGGTKTLPASTAADVTNHHQFGMINAMNRTNKDYMIEKDSGPNDILIRPFHYYESKIPNNSGQHKARVNIVGNLPEPGAYMFPTTGQFRQRDAHGDPNYFVAVPPPPVPPPLPPAPPPPLPAGTAPDPDNAFQDTDGSTFTVLTNHHEMGHATGNPDEYLYSMSDLAGNTWGGLPDYAQPNTAEGGPFTCDKISRMLTNRTMRLRHVWKFVCWLHDASAPGTATAGQVPHVLNKFFSGTRFKITFRATSFVHNFQLPEANRNVFLPAKRGINIAMSSNVNADLLLYKLGDDEVAHLIKTGQIFKGILVVKTKFALRFDNGTSNWTLNDKRRFAARLNNDYLNMCNFKFGMTSTTAGDFDKLYVHFSPHYKEFTSGFLSSGAPSDSHVNVIVTFRNGGAFTSSGNLLRVDADTNRNRIIRFCFGLATGQNNLVKTDFGNVVAFAASPAGVGTPFTMIDI